MSDATDKRELEIAAGVLMLANDTGLAEARTAIVDRAALLGVAVADVVAHVQAHGALPGPAIDLGDHIGPTD